MRAVANERFTDAEYAAMAADYEANPPTADEVLSIEVNPAFLRSGRSTEGRDAHQDRERRDE